MAITPTTPASSLPLPSSTSTPAATSTNSTSAASSAQPVTVPPANPPTVDPVIVASNKLFKTAVANLWEENVTKASFFGSIAGLFIYFWNKSTAATEDAQFGPTIDKINEVLPKLLKAVSERALTQEEALRAGVPAITFTNGSQQTVYAQGKLAAEAQLKEFYDLFKERVTQLGIANNSNDFGVYAAAATKRIQDSAKNQKEHIDVKKNIILPNEVIDTTATLAPKIETTMKEFNIKIFYDMVNGYAAQPIENITIDSFKQKVVQIKGFFTANDTVEIETELRKAIKLNHDSTQFNTIRGEFLNPAADAPRFVAAKAALEAKYTADRTALQAELDGYRGSNGTNGTINTAYEASQAAEAAKNQAYIALVTAFQQPANGLNATDVATTLERIVAYLGTGTAAAPSSIATVQGLLTTYQEKARAFEEKKSAHDALVARFGEIAQYAGTNVSGGQLFDLNANLQPANLDTAARVEATKNANFYNELNQVVGENNSVVRSSTLRGIIGQ